MIGSRRTVLATPAAGAAAWPRVGAAHTLPDPIELMNPSDLFAARYYAPAVDNRRTFIVLVFGDSEGGFAAPRMAEALARAGHPTLAMAYSQGSEGSIHGLPDRLEEVALESNLKVFNWIERQDDLRGRPIHLIGEGRGAELAVLLAQRRPRIAGLVLYSPSSVVWGAEVERGGVAWRISGRAIPAADVGRPATDVSYDRRVVALRAAPAAAALSLRATNAPALLIAGAEDNVWPAAEMADAFARTAPAGERRCCGSPAVIGRWFQTARPGLECWRFWLAPKAPWIRRLDRQAMEHWGLALAHGGRRSQPQRAGVAGAVEAHALELDAPFQDTPLGKKGPEPVVGRSMRRVQGLDAVGHGTRHPCGPDDRRVRHHALVERIEGGGIEQVHAQEADGLTTLDPPGLATDNPIRPALAQPNHHPIGRAFAQTEGLGDVVAGRRCVAFESQEEVDLPGGKRLGRAGGRRRPPDALRDVATRPRETRPAAGAWDTRRPAH